MSLERARGLTLQEIAAAAGGHLTGPGAACPTGYSIDSRTIKRGDLFFAIVGPHHDGHRFLSDAAAKGAAGLVVSDLSAIPEGGVAAPVIAVADTLRALQDLASSMRRRLPVKVVGITGSAGKTTTKEMTRQVLEAAFSVHASRGNLNNLYGCPLSLLELQPVHQISVLEMGMSYPGELTRLAEIADPDIGILTNVSGAHLAHFESLEEVARAKGELFAGMRENSIGIFNSDDERCRRIMGSFKGYAFTFGIEHAADLTATDYRMDGLDGATFEVRHEHNGGLRRVPVRTRFVGLHHVYNALAALSAGYMLGISLEDMAARLGELSPLGMRGRVLRLKESVRVLDDSYNSNPAAARFAVQVLSEAEPAEPTGRRILVFGDMLELGEAGVEAHREIGRVVAASRIDVVVGVGPLAAEMVGAVEGGGKRTHRFGTSDEAAAFVAGQAVPGDVVLVKGSRGVALERVVGALSERFGEE